MKSALVKNHWYLYGFCYWQSELSFEDDIIWINIGFHLPLAATKQDFQHTLAVSAYTYVQKFN